MSVEVSARMRTCRLRFGGLRTTFVCLIFFILIYMVKQAWDASELERHEHDRLQRELLAHYHSNNGNISDALSDAMPLVYYNKEVPLIWIGGVPRSGTTLMRAMLDAHPDVRCGEETRIIPRILGIHQSISKIDLEMKRLQEAHITEEVLNNAMAAYILSIIEKHGEPAPRLCNKDPFTLRSIQRILTMFPNSKFLLMLRDGRATVHSIISRKVTIKGFDITSYRGALKDWNKAISNMYSECLHVGHNRCLPVHYEQLVLHPKAQMIKILNFLDVPWNDVVLQHEKMIGQEGGVSLSKRELSTDQVNKPVNLGALTKWVGHIPTDVSQEIRMIAPMLETLGYDPDAYPPNYGTPDKNVLEASLQINKMDNKTGDKVDHLDVQKDVEQEEKIKQEVMKGERLENGGKIMNLNNRRFKGDETR